MSDNNCSHLGEPEFCAGFISDSTRGREQVVALRQASYLGKDEVVVLRMTQFSSPRPPARVEPTFWCENEDTVLTCEY